MTPHLLIQLFLGLYLRDGLLISISGHLQRKKLLIPAKICHLVLFILLLINHHLLHLLLLRNHHLILGHRRHFVPLNNAFGFALFINFPLLAFLDVQKSERIFYEPRLHLFVYLGVVVEAGRLVDFEEPWLELLVKHNVNA
jgi:hypothetical protein